MRGRPLNSLLVVILILVLSFSSSIGQNSQLYERVWHPFNNHFAIIENIVTDDNGDFYVSGTARDRNAFPGGEDYAYIAKMDMNGQTLWEQQFNNPNDRSIGCYSMDLAPNGDVVIAGEKSGCDYGTNEGFVMRLTPNGVQVWRNDYQGSSFDTSYAFTALKVLQNGEIVLGFWDFIMHLDANGNTVELVEHTYGIPRDIAEGSLNNVIFASTSGLVDYTLQAPASLTQYPVPASVQEVEYIKGNGAVGDHLFYLSNDELHCLDYQFNSQGSLNLTNFAGGPFQTMVADDTGVWIVGGDSVLKMDTSFQIVKSFSRPAGATYYPQSVDLQVNPQTQIPEYLILAGLHGRGVTIQSMDLNGNHGSTGSDLRILSTRTDNEDFTNGINYDLWATIINDGADSVTYCRFFAHTRTQNICGANYIFPEFGNLSLAPGDSIELYLAYIQDMNTFQFPLHNYSLDLCVLAPNQSIDYVSQGDCIQMSPDSLPVGIVDGSIDYAVEVYPNPASERVRIRVERSSPIDSVPYQLYNLQGSMLMKGELEASETELSLENIAPGIYMLQVGKSTHKVVKL